MAKMIKFDLPIDGVKAATLDDLRGHFTTEIIGHFRSGLLARWLRSRDLPRELTAVEALEAGDDSAVLKELCRIFDVEANDDAIAAAVAEATGVPGIRPDRMPKPQIWNPGDTFQDCPECPKMVVVPSGSFMMGSPKDEEGRFEDEGPLHEVTIGYSFAVGVYPVTFDQWDAYVSDGGARGHKPGDEGWDRGRRPVINVSWKDARTYTEWLSWKTGNRYRLLSESEWEYVARAGTATRYWFGDEIDNNQANFRGSGPTDALQKTTPVGYYAANAFGLYDVHGNVYEWVEDRWNNGYFVSKNTGNIRAPSDGTAQLNGLRGERVARGGSWADESKHLRSAKRSVRTSSSAGSNVGFRVARTVTP